MENIKIALRFLGVVVFFIFGLILANGFIIVQGEKAVVTNFGEISKKIFCTSSKNCFW